MAGSVSSQKKIRDLQRLLARKADTLTEEDKASIQQKIADLQQEKTQNIQKDVKRKHENKYHMVKFFERKKVTRHYEYLLKRLEKLNDDITPNGEDFSKEELQQAMRDLEDDLTYIMYYPVDKKYIALFAGSEEVEHEGDRPTQRGPVSLRRCQLSGKAKATSDDCRVFAHSAREKDKVVGGDLVQHAIDVQIKNKKDDDQFATTTNGLDNNNNNNKTYKQSAATVTSVSVVEYRGGKQTKRGREDDSDRRAPKKAATSVVDDQKCRSLADATTTVSSSSSSNNNNNSASNNTVITNNNKVSLKPSTTTVATAAASDGFFLEEASAEDLVAHEVAASDGKKSSSDRNFTFIKQAVDRKKYNTHKKLHGHKQDTQKSSQPFSKKGHHHNFNKQSRK
jgi:vacuolar-type H+-ATPase subunit E/Vma4